MFSTLICQMDQLYQCSPSSVQLSSSISIPGHDGREVDIQPSPGRGQHLHLQSNRQGSRAGQGSGVRSQANGVGTPFRVVQGQALGVHHGPLVPHVLLRRTAPDVNHNLGAFHHRDGGLEKSSQVVLSIIYPVNSAQKKPSPKQQKKKKKKKSREVHTPTHKWA